MVFSTSYRNVAGLLLAGFLAACGGEQTGGTTGPPAGLTVAVSPATASLTVIGGTQQFTATATDNTGATVSATFTWSTSSTSVAVVNSSGLATAVGDGTAQITATTQGVAGSGSLSVAIAVSAVEVNPGMANLLSIGATIQLSAVAKDASGNAIPGKAISWASSDLAVATVDATGLVTSAGNGTATITATTEGVQGSSTVTVTQPGAGSQTLLVIANVLGNDLGGGLFATDFDVTLTDVALAPVSGATVTITNATLGVVTLTETVPGVSGVYTGVAASFPAGDFQLDVVSGADNVLGVVVSGTGVHAITAPLVNGVVAAGQPLTVTWSMPEQAKLAEIETRDFATVTVTDNGSFQIPGTSNPASTNQRIRVFRFNEVDIAGGLPLSIMQVKIRAQIEPVLVQFSLTFSGDATFQGPHTGHSIYVAVVRPSDGAVLATQNGTVSGTMDPSFSFSFPAVFETGVAYEVHYWIDSNFGGGTVGVCDPKAIDHQWNVAVPAVLADVSITELHDATATADVCASFP